MARESSGEGLGKGDQWVLTKSHLEVISQRCDTSGDKIVTIDFRKLKERFVNTFSHKEMINI